MLEYIIFIYLFVCGVIAGYHALRFFRPHKFKYVENRYMAGFSLGSAIWSLGFCSLWIQTDPEYAYWCRTIGLIGTFIFLSFALINVAHYSKISIKFQFFLRIFSLTGIPVYFMIVQKDQAVYLMENGTMTYYFVPGLPNNLYTAYSVCIAILFLTLNIHMYRKSGNKRTRVFSKQFFLAEFFVVLGMVLDTILPLIGKSAIPGSTITQFFGLVVLYHAVSALNHTRITNSNMSEFIYTFLSEPILVYDTDRKLHIANDAASSFLNLKQQALEIEDVSIYTLFDLENEDKVFSFDSESQQFDIFCKIRKCYCNLSVSKIRDSYQDIIGYIIMVKDLSERFKAMENLREAKLEAEKANKAKSIFLANMSHEIRTPMNAIMGFSELALKTDLNGPAREYIADIKSSSKSLLAIINDILDISKLESGKMELVCTKYCSSDLLHDVYLIINGQAQKKGLKFTMDITPDLPREFYGDMVRIREILINLLNNAVKYTRQGNLSLQVKMLNKENNVAIVEYTVSDTGIGIHPEELPHLFETFTQLDLKSNQGIEGTGLGLSIVKGFVDLMNGTIKVESDYGNGSVFIVTLPQTITDEVPIEAFSQQQDTSNDEFSLGQIRFCDTKILIVDDNPINLKVAKDSMQYYGLSVDTAKNGKESIDCCLKTDYDIVFMDQMMPEMNGVQAMTMIRDINTHYAAGGDGKIIALTANAISGVREQLIDEGFDEYLEKPINFNQFELLMKKFLPQERIQFTSSNAKPESDANIDSQKLAKLLPSIDTSLGLSYCNNQISQYLAVLMLLLENGNQQMSLLQTQLEENNCAQYRVTIHALKGQFLNVGAKELAATAKDLEQAAKEENLSFLTDHTPSFLLNFFMLIGDLEKLSREFNLSTNQTPAEKEFLQQLQEALTNYDIAKASELIEKGASMELSAEYTDLFDQLSPLMEEMELEKMLELIENFI